MTIGEFYDCVDGYKKRIKANMEIQDSLNHILGGYISTGVNAPKKYPKKPALQKKSSKVQKMTTHMIGSMLGAKINGTN